MATPTPTARTHTSDGFIDFPYQGEVHQTYYRIFGDLENRTRPPVVALHGGPGISHDYIIPIADLTDQSYPVIMYDQIGNARSTHLPDKPPTFWTIELFIDELENLLKHFGIQDGYHIVGHSWGGILGSEFSVQRQPAGLRRLVISNSPPSIALWAESNKEINKNFPQAVQDALEKQFENREAYWNAVKEMYAFHGCRVKPFPKEVEYSLLQIFAEDADRSVDKARVLKDWTIIDRLHLVNVPTLVISARHDVGQVKIMKPFADNIPNAKWHIFQDSSHMPFWEEREAWMQLVGTFLAEKDDV
ncbi:proline-specific peptidase [Trametes gibbosa]|nr:proline-specific peptidase [Trametes gibbosa]